MCILQNGPEQKLSKTTITTKKNNKHVIRLHLTSSLKKHVFYNWLINNILYLCVT